MTRRIRTPDKLVEKIQEKVDERVKKINKELDDSEDCRRCAVGGIYRLAKPDETGCNWELMSYSGPQECAGLVKEIVGQLRKQYNLPKLPDE
jgi:hypothetical protein